MFFKQLNITVQFAHGNPLLFLTKNLQKISLHSPKIFKIENKRMCKFKKPKNISGILSDSYLCKLVFLHGQKVS